MLRRHHHPITLAAVGAACVVLAVGCGTADDAASPPTGSGNQSNTSSSSTTTVEPTTASTTSVPPPTTTDQPANSTAPTTRPRTTAPSPTGSLQIPIPAGTFSAGPTDLFVLSRSGDLELWSEALAPPVGPRTLVADCPNPFGVVNEGSGPNVIDHVAGEVGGTVVFGDCCEPISGTLLAATGRDEIARIAGGYSPTLSPTGDLLGAANDYQISRTAADRSGAGIFRSLNQDPEVAYLNVGDLTWSSNATATGDDDHMILLAWTDDGWWLHDVDRSTLDLTPVIDLDVPAVSEAPDTDVYFAGMGPDAEVVVAQSNAETTRLRYFAATTLTEVTDLERSLPASATSVRLEGDGLGLLWVDGGSLFYLPAGEFEATRLGADVLAAWFARSVEL